MTNQPKPAPGNDPDLARAVAAYLAGDESAADGLYHLLHGPVHAEAQQFLARDNIDFDDIVQDSLLAVLDYVRKNGGFSGDLIKFAVTVVRNRCRNLLNSRQRWRQVPIETLRDRLTSALLRNPLEALEDAEIRGLVQEALDQLGPECRALLHALYRQGKACKEMIGPLGLKSVHGVYRRRSSCLLQLNRIVKKRLDICSSPKGKRPLRSTGTAGPKARK